MSRRISTLGLLIGLIAILGPGARAEVPPQPENLVEIDHALSLDFETLHTKWAQPYALGTIRVLFLAPWYQGSTDGREMVELMQRFDIDGDAVHIIGGNRLIGDGNPRWYVDPEAGTKRVLRLLEEPYDAVFLNRVRFDSLPEKVRARIEEQVREGAGLLVSGAVDYPAFAAPPVGDSTRELRDVGKGRVLALPDRDRLEFDLGWETTFDLQMAEQGRALLAVATREPEMPLSIEAPSTPVSRNGLSETRIGIEWGAIPHPTEIRVEIRRFDGDKRLLGVVQADRSGRTEFNLPPLRAGNYTLEAIARSPRGIENWALAPLEVVSERGVAKVTLTPDWVEIGEALSGTVEFEGSLKATDSVQINLIDKDGRILDRVVKPVQERGGSHVPAEVARGAASSRDFKFEIAPWTPMLLRVEAALMEGEEEVDAAYAYANVVKRHHDRFNFIVWNYPGGDLAPYALESMANLGATAILQGGQPPRMLAASELAFVPYASSFRWSSRTTTAMLDENGVLKNGCVHDATRMNEIVRETVERHLPSRRHGTLYYSLGDENAVRASCLSEHCLHAYRAYLKKEYGGDIAKLNREWGAEYASFDDITLLQEGDLPSSEAPKWFRDYFELRLELNRTNNEGSGDRQIELGDINDEMRALQTENYARWYDRQAFQNRTYLDWCNRYVKAFRELDPKSRTGFEGTDSFTIRRYTTRSRQGGDLDAFVREMEFFGPYPGPANEVVRSIQPPKYPSGNWTGYSMVAEKLLEEYWDMITNGMNTPQWWRWDNLDGYHGFISPFFVPFPEVREMLDDTRIVREGLGDLLMECEIHDDSVAMLYSLPSTYIAHFDENPTYGLQKRDHDLWRRAIQDSGLQFRYVTDRMLRLGEFDPSKFKVLILPLAFAIGEQEAEVIRDFVEGGGTVIADVRPGTYTDHCRPLEQGILDDLFGIERKGKRDAFGIDRMRVQGEIAGVTVEMSWGNWHGKDIYPLMKVDPAVSVTTGKALGQAALIHYWDMNRPVCIVNEVGKGRAILLNFPIYESPAQPLIEDLLASAGATPKIRVANPEGESIPGLELTRWKNGEVELIALFGDYEGEVEVMLPETREVVELKTGASLGETDSFQVSVRPYRAAFFALHPRTPQTPKLSLDLDRVPRGRVAMLTLQIPSAAGFHAVHLTATDPHGAAVDWLKQPVVLGGKPRSIPIPIAHNDPVGDWTLHVRDILTGLQTNLEFVVDPE